MLIYFGTCCTGTFLHIVFCNTYFFKRKPQTDRKQWWKHRTMYMADIPTQVNYTTRVLWKNVVGSRFLEYWSSWIGRQLHCKWLPVSTGRICSRCNNCNIVSFEANLPYTYVNKLILETREAYRGGTLYKFKIISEICFVLSFSCCFFLIIISVWFNISLCCFINRVVIFLSCATKPLFHQ